jgi:amino-acid N-acetyltransferase
MIQIKEAKKKDFEELKNIISKGAKEGKILKRNKNELQKLVLQKNLLIAIDEEKIIGLAALDYYSKRFSELRTLYILPEHRSKGAGAMLVNAVIEKAKKKKIKELMTITTKETAEWFKRHGFCEEAHKLKVALFKEI